jgi:hypothetical protein
MSRRIASLCLSLALMLGAGSLSFAKAACCCGETCKCENCTCEKECKCGGNCGDACKRNQQPAPQPPKQK